MQPGKNRAIGYLCVLAAAVCWGLIGIPNRALTHAGFGQSEVVFTRAFIAFIGVATYLLVRDPRAIRIRLADAWIFAGVGIVSITGLSYSYFGAQQLLSLSASCVLMYLAPVFVVFSSALLFGEKVTRAKVVALLLVLAGAVAASGLAGGVGQGSAAGVGLGVLAGLTYASYSVFSRFALERGYGTWTILFWAFGISSLVSGLLMDTGNLVALTDATTIPYELMLGVACCLAPYLLYTTGLRHIETGPASIVSTAEVAAATIVGIVAFGEELTVMSALGVALVFAGVVVMNLRGGR